MKKIDKNGFTLIELLVVIAIIAILATISIISLSSVRLKARDVRRVADIKQVQSALELYFTYNNFYPTMITPGSSLTDGIVTYIDRVPSNPSPSSDGDCSANQNYIYTSSSDGTSYTLSFCLGNQISSLNSGEHIATPVGITNNGNEENNNNENTENNEIPPVFACGDNVNYGDEDYSTVQIGDQCWFKNNLNIGTRVDGDNNQANANSGVIQKYCYDDNTSNCSLLGALYQWHTAMAFPSSCDNHNGGSPCIVNLIHQGICPTGWHIPSDGEWTTLTRYVSSSESCNPDNGCSPAATKLKASSPLWDGTNDFNFDALPSGYRGNNGQFTHDGSRANFWATLSDDDDKSYRRYLNNGDAKVNRNDDKKIFGYSVRCLKD